MIQRTKKGNNRKAGMNFKENESPEKLRGHYYTDRQIATFLSRWVLEKKPERILEPGCGNGVFIESIAHSKHLKLKSLVGLEIEANEAEKAREKSHALKHTDVQIYTKEFLAWTLVNIFNPPMFDGVLGNPPFIRYQYLEDKIQKRAQKIFSLFNLKFTKHTNAWVPFVISSIALLKPGGRLAMVVPAEILHVLHAESLRKFLTAQCSRILIFDPEELWFDNVLQGAVLLLAEKKQSKEEICKGIAIIPTKNRSFLDDDASKYFENANFVNGEVLSGRKWMRALLTSSEKELLDNVFENPKVFMFHQIADVDVGIVTGANKYFLVADSVIKEFGLENWAYPMFGRSEHVRGVIYDKRNHNENKKRGLPTNFVWFNFNKGKNDLPDGVKNYILYGEKQNLHTRYKCRIRNPWYTVPSVYISPVGMLKRCHDFPRLIYNKAKAFTTDTAYRIKSTKRISYKKLVFSFVNSLTALSSELEGRHYGGGVLELVPSEIEHVLIPFPEIDFKLESLDGYFRNSVAPEKILLTQDEYLLRPLGLSRKDCLTLFSAWDRLRKRRQRVKSE